MQYFNIVPGIFTERLNRFVARVLINGQQTEVHVKNTGRCRELLTPGSEVWLSASDAPARKTKYDLIAVRKSTGVLFNIDSQAPNKVVREWLERQGVERIRPEFPFGSSRIDFCLELPRSGAQTLRYLLEVKGCTLERDGIGYFPDAPTERGVKHLRELIRAAESGLGAAVAFVMQAESIRTVLPNDATDPAFGEALRDAAAAGVRILALPCRVEPDRLEIVGNEEL